MKIVADANILFSSLIKEGKSIELLLNFSLNIFVPEFILSEIEEHKKEIIEKTNRKEEELNEIFSLISQIITIIPKEEFEDCIKQAEIISPDPDDIQYFALALKLKCPIWTNDKRMKEQDIVRIYSTEEIIKELNYL